MKKIKLILVLTLTLALVLLASSCMMLPTTQTQTCVVHRDINKDLFCDVCGAAVPVNCVVHTDADHDGKCDTNGCTVTLPVEHIDPDHTGICEVCGRPVKVNHEDFDEEDGLCDICGKPIDGSCLECVDKDKNGKCDVCGNEIKVPVEPCDKCVDENGDLVCDVCGSKIEICVHTDQNFDGKCDKCKTAIEGAIQILNKGTTQFKLVLANGSNGDQVMLRDKLKKELLALGVTIEEGYDADAEVVEYEILLGTIKNRDDEYKLDPHVFGPEGYTAQLIGNKIVILGGSEKALTYAIDAFKESFLGITETTKSLKNAVRYVTAAQNVIMIQDDYDVDTITLEGEDIRDYKIVASIDSPHAYDTALALQNTLYYKTGYWLDIVEPADAPAEKVIIITYAAKTGGDGFSATFTDGKMEFVSEYSTVMSDITSFFTKKLAIADGTLNISKSESYVKNVRDVFYKDYGANGDDDKDDSDAIRAAHEYANQDGHRVIASPGATYYLGAMTQTIRIMTDVDWKDARFMVQDHLISPDMAARSVNIFTIPAPTAPSLPMLAERRKEINAAGGIDASTFTSFEVELDQAYLLRVYDNNHMNYIRYGVNASDGAKQQEVILIDKHGNIDPTTPFMHDFEQITSIAAYPIDVTPITIQGGSFYTSPWYTDTPQGYTSYARAIQCNRSNVTFRNIKHYLINEGDYQYNNHANSTDYGCPYGGFFSVNLANNVVYENCQFAAHITYKGSNGAGMGTYDLSPGSATNIVYKDCYQEEDNFNNASGQSRWGVMGSSYCKNVTFQDCYLTRFDAHNGIHNADIINTEIKMIRINGTGTFRMDGSTMYSNTFIGLREDYGGYWHGNIIIKDSNIVTGNGNISLFTNTWYNHYFGYPAATPTNIIIDGLRVFKDQIDGTVFTDAAVKLFGDGYLNGAKNSMLDYIPVLDSNKLPMSYPNGKPVVLPNKNQIPPPERIIIRNCNVNIILPDLAQYPWFETTVFEVDQNEECVAHFDWWGDGKCDDCGADFTPCTEHTDYNNDGHCTWCGQDTVIVCEKHVDKELNGKCDVCHVDYICDGHLDADEDRICDKCGGVLGCPGAHTDADADGYCDVCKKLIPTCKDGCVDEKNHLKQDKRDSKCDVCGADMVATIEPCETCVDENPVDSKCDVCGGDMPAAEEE